MRVRQMAPRALLLMLAAVSVAAARDSHSALIDAVKAKNHGAIRALIQQHADVNAVDPDGSTALHWAVYGDDNETVELLIHSGANVRALNRYGVMPLALACTNGNVAIVEALL